MKIVLLQLAYITLSVATGLEALVGRSNSLNIFKPIEEALPRVLSVPEKSQLQLASQELKRLPKARILPGMGEESKPLSYILAPTDRQKVNCQSCYPLLSSKLSQTLSFSRIPGLSRSETYFLRKSCKATAHMVKSQLKHLNNGLNKLGHLPLSDELVPQREYYRQIILADINKWTAIGDLVAKKGDFDENFVRMFKGKVGVYSVQPAQVKFMYGDNIIEVLRRDVHR